MSYTLNLILDDGYQAKFIRNGKEFIEVIIYILGL